MLVKCVYCDTENDALATGGYCETCGKKLPRSALVKPRRTLGGDAPEGEAVPLPRRSRLVAEALLAAAVVYLAAGGLFLIVGPALYPRVPEQFAPFVLSWTVLPTLFLAGLALLARWQPLPAVWLALAATAAWVALSFVLHPVLALGWLLVDAALTALLLRAAWVGLKPEKRAAG